MTNLFYLTVIIFIIYEMFSFANASRIKEKKDAADKALKEGGDVYKKWASENGKTIAYYLFNIVYMFFLFAGLLTSQWVFFGVVILMSFIPKKSVPVMKIDSVITIAIFLFIILNKYHFHLNIF